ncbi:SHQ1-domain-containing protein [Peniophora sp. CONT]|nr:SHQ1-domain-containing protein [Peniophora sp. CONT]
MITPRFSCSQTPDSVITRIYCPSVRASDVEIHVADTLLSVHIAPYFLRLTFPSSVLEDDASGAVYDPASGYLTVTLTKEQKGEDFPDLDLLAKLLAPRPSAQTQPQGPLIEVLGSEDDEGVDLAEQTRSLSLEESTLTQEQREILTAAENDWRLPQTVPEPLPDLHTSLAKPYGFLNLHIGFLRHVVNTENEVNELGPDAETLPPSERRRLRLEKEEKKWDEEYYMADYADPSMIDEVIAMHSPFVPSSNAEDVEFSEEEKLEMLRLPRREYLTLPADVRATRLTLLTVLFAAAYDTRTTQGDPTPESAWTVCALTPAFAALDPAPYTFPPSFSPPHSSSPDDLELQATLATSYRRALAYPLYRSWALAEACRRDVGALLSHGRRAILRALLRLRDLLNKHEVYYVYARIWIDDFCSWVQHDE